ncbi:UDP-glucosyltransferase 2-like isoform X2 [Daktulosphaira vitifoliae]|nr:UDP-glucosyltransferase 2-like isoform X2 [Daktulosphaira vitifoliae]XP_050522157.1 UDP-glucosyltransferase 2-like isoform X2 [Daktulosphaira vitifoliae]XP_050522158.1 UDP-glucosyltransferase 2-like isoform X2 [Daktulosphaira vitifoliae]
MCLYMTLFISQVLGMTNILNAAEILAVSPIPGTSHWNVMSSVLEILMDRGHKITVVSAFPRKIPHENYTNIDISNLVHISVAEPWEKVIGVFQPPVSCLHFLNDIHQKICQIIYSLPEFQRILSTKRFDVVITELLGSRCDLYLGNYLNIPQIAIVSSQMLTWYQESFDNPANPSYITPLHISYPKSETFIHRLLSTINYLTINISFKYYDNRATEIGRMFFGENKPDAETLLRNVSIVFLNTHSSYDLPKPLANNFKEIGGIHLKPLKPLPNDLQKIIDEAEHGVIYFNLGSVTRMHDLPTNIQNGFKEGFAELPQKVLWKYESDTPMTGQPKNVFTRKWLPQYDIIRHPNVKLFISHGGNSGVIEAISAGIPVLGFPLFFDQPRNLELFKYWGSGLLLDYKNFTKQIFLEKVKEIINNHKFKKNAMELSRKFHDRPISPQDTVVYWTEYVMRHNGAHHLKSNAINTLWYQYFLIDILGTIVIILFITISIFFFIKKKCF